MTLGALGVVYGDIGTSPLYAMKECFYGPHSIEVSEANVFGVLSLIFWSLILIVSIKYLLFVMRADNRGEGGILSLMSLMKPRSHRRGRWVLVALALFGAALLYGDGVITPAISVLSAVEGLNVATTFFTPYVIPVTITILVALFVLQSRGTAGIGAIFGPLTLVWFIVLFTLGMYQFLRFPSVIAAMNPLHGVRFFAANGWHSFITVGLVVLAITGAEALYLDMGHFGRRPIRLAWFSAVLPALLMNYFGQGALLLRNPQAAEHLFFEMAPKWGLYPLVALATAAASVASQAVISGAFSMTRQAVQLGFIPRMAIEHTSAREIGQIYIPTVNWMLMIVTIGLVVFFGSASALAGAYGIAVTTAMLMTTTLLFVVQRERWGWKLIPSLLFTGALLVIELSFFGANALKIPQGGWFPLLLAAVVFTLMTTWKRGRNILTDRLMKDSLPVELFLQSLERNPPHRVPGTAVFLFRNAAGTPTALLHNLKHNKVLHKRVLLATVLTEETPVVDESERTTVESLGQGVYRVIIRYGFTEDPNIPEALETVVLPEPLNPSDTTYFLGRETLIATKHPGMAIWREKLFAWMTRNARSATAFYRIPPNRVVELGAQIEL